MQLTSPRARPNTQYPTSKNPASLPLRYVEAGSRAVVRGARNHALKKLDDTLDRLLGELTPLVGGGGGGPFVLGVRDVFDTDVFGEEVHRHGRLELAGVAWDSRAWTGWS